MISIVNGEIEETDDMFQPINTSSTYILPKNISAEEEYKFFIVAITFDLQEVYSA